MNYEAIIYEKKGQVCNITLNRPQVLNAINRKMLSELNHVLDEIKSDDDARLVILRGKGRAFCAGFDLKEEIVDVVSGAEEWFTRFSNDWDIQLKIWNLDKPVLAVVQGYCLGGAFGLMMLCDFCIASDDAKFGMPEERYGFGPGMGSIVFNIGSLKKAKEIMLGEKISAKEAEVLGLINYVVAPDLIEDCVEKFVNNIIHVPKAGISMSKHFINNIVETMGMSHAVAYGTALTSIRSGSKEFLDLEQERKDLGPDQISGFFKQRTEVAKKND